MGTWDVVFHIVRQIFKADWGHLRLYVMLALLFSLSLGACLPFEKFREAFLGVVLLVVALAVVCSLFGVRSAVGTTPTALTGSPASAWVRSLRDFLEETTGMALIMMLCGIMAATIAGIIIRIAELAGRASTGSKKTGRSRRGTETNAAA